MSSGEPLQMHMQQNPELGCKKAIKNCNSLTAAAQNQALKTKQLRKYVYGEKARVKCQSVWNQG